MKSYALALRNRIKLMIAGLIAGIMVGIVVLGLGGRLLMRLIALIGGLTPGISLGGTLEVVAFGGITGGFAGITYGFIHAILPKNSWLKGIAFGLLIYGFLLLIPFDSKMVANGFPQLKLLIYILFGALCLLYGLLVIPAIHRTERKLRS